MRDNIKSKKIKKFFFSLVILKNLCTFAFEINL